MITFDDFVRLIVLPELRLAISNDPVFLLEQDGFPSGLSVRSNIWADLIGLEEELYDTVRVDEISAWRGWIETPRRQRISLSMPKVFSDQWRIQNVCGIEVVPFASLLGHCDQRSLDSVLRDEDFNVRIVLARYKRSIPNVRT